MSAELRIIAQVHCRECGDSHYTGPDAVRLATAAAESHVCRPKPRCDCPYCRRQARG